MHVCTLHIHTYTHVHKYAGIYIILWIFHIFTYVYICDPVNYLIYLHTYTSYTYIILYTQGYNKRRISGRI